MKTNTFKIGAALLAVAISVCCTRARAQTATTVTTTRGAFTEFVPGSETLVVRTDAPTPVRYVVTKQTTFVDETGTPVLVNQIAPGSPLSVQYTTTGDRLVASRIVVQHAPVVERSTTTTTTTRRLTRDEKEQAKEQIEKRKDALDKAKDKLDDDDDD